MSSLRELVQGFCPKRGSSFSWSASVTFSCIGMMRREEHAKRPGFVASMKKLDRRRKPEVNRVTRHDLAALNVQKTHQRNPRPARGVLPLPRPPRPPLSGSKESKGYRITSSRFGLVLDFAGESPARLVLPNHA